ncbi:hypothetical protein [Streptomyces sp. NPDC048551]|uniref:hypothetical protein n=1 Tax=Streptomyces sp. NPDC048551 TaxID=3155758 RepID=UPI00342DB166
MGGWKHARNGSHGHPVRRAALLLLIAFGVAAGVAFLCVRPVSGHGGDGMRAGARVQVEVEVEVAVRVQGQGQVKVQGQVKDGRVRAAGQVARVACVSPYDLPGCSPLARVTPAVLPAPPSAVALPPAGAAPAARPSATAGPVRAAGPPPRAPGLYVLQVLRT